MDDLQVPFIFVPQGDPEPRVWMAQHPGWVKFPAVMIPRDSPDHPMTADGNASPDTPGAAAVRTRVDQDSASRHTPSPATRQSYAPMATSGAVFTQDTKAAILDSPAALLERLAAPFAALGIVLSPPAGARVTPESRGPAAPPPEPPHP